MNPDPTSSWSSDTVGLFLLRPEDVTGEYVAWLNDPAVNRYLESRFRHHDLHSTRAFVERCLASSDSLLLGIRAHALGGRHIGNIKIGPVQPAHGVSDVGILIGETAAWGQGLATEAISLTSRIARDTMSLRKLCAGCYAANVGSRLAFEHAGFRIEGTRRDHYLLDGQPHDAVLLARWLD